MKEKIRVLQIVGNMDRGGVETFNMNILRSINRNEFDFLFLCYSERKFDYEDEIVKLGAKIIRISSAYNMISVIREIKKHNINTIHAHTMFGSVYSIIAGFLAKVPVRVVHSHSTITGGRSIIRYAYRFVSGLLINRLSTHRVACSVDAGRTLFGNGRFNVVHNGIELTKFTYNEEARISLRRELGIDSGSTVIGHVGRFDVVKNHSFLLKSFREYLTVDPLAVLVLVGDGPMRPSIEALAKKLSIANHLILLGKRPDVNLLYSVMDILVFPSLSEGLPLTLVEAQVSGLPCIVSNAIPSEAKLSTNLQFIDLDKKAEVWAQEISNSISSTRTGSSGIDFSEYDVLMTTETLVNIYNNRTTTR